MDFLQDIMGWTDGNIWLALLVLWGLFVVVPVVVWCTEDKAKLFRLPEDEE